ncbi:hypothetical protein R1flu_006562 [Riccia fluitans]|uniref:Uncharacterized protein n=1 Tax=Riccia fluitans TaxID=41844 RepID=A0ABD1YWK5_9MARC
MRGWTIFVSIARMCRMSRKMKGEGFTVSTVAHDSKNFVVKGGEDLEGLYYPAIRRDKGCRKFFFGIDTPARYFQAGSEGSRKEKNDDVKELAGKEHSDGPAENDAMSRNPIVNLDRNIDSGPDLDHVWDTLLYAGFGVGIHTSNNDVKQEKPMENLPDYCHLWD